MFSNLETVHIWYVCEDADSVDGRLQMEVPEIVPTCFSGENEFIVIKGVQWLNDARQDVFDGCGYT